MIKILKEMDKITIKGHANYSESNDIVCASVSSIMYTTVNAILNKHKLVKSYSKNTIRIVRCKEIRRYSGDITHLLYIPAALELQIVDRHHALHTRKERIITETFL